MADISMEKPKAEDLLDIAKSYYDERKKLVYSIKGNTFLSGGEIYDMEHDMRGRIDCSTYIHLILQGIPYEKSPYVTGNTEDFFLSDCPWAQKNIAELLFNNEPIRKAHQLAKHYSDQGMARLDEDWKPGDILFFQVKPDKLDFYLSFNIFRGIYHIGIVSDNKDEMYESSGNQTVGIENNYIRPGIQISPINSRSTPLFYVRLSE